jgi:imidazolonepropionase-like amidohydrolase
MPVTERTALTEVRVFDGRRLLPPATVVIDGGVLGSDPAGARVVDCEGAVLLPGLIDAHVHLEGVDHLEQLREYGVTTALDMGAWPPSRVEALRARADGGLTDFRTAGTLAIGRGGMHAQIPGMPEDGFVTDPAAAERFVNARVAERVDYLKVVVEAPGRGGPDQPTLNALVAAAHAHGKRVVAHASATGAVAMAQQAGADVLTHVPLDAVLDAEQAARMAVGRRICVPTLTMMEAAATLGRPGVSYDHARASVEALHWEDVPLLAGTDANATPGVPVNLPHGSCLHHELELLVEAGLSTVDALRAATVLPARHFGLTDRGVVAPGMRADLVLLAGDPLADIRATRTVRRVWCAGREYLPSA